MKETTFEYYQSRMQQCKRYIQQNLFTNITLEEIASETCFSTYHFHRLFTAFCGESVASYIKRLRIEAAAGRIALTDVPFSQIAKETCFQTPTAFSKAFKGYFGVSPSEYRNEKRDEFKSVLTQTNNESNNQKCLDVEYYSLNTIKVLSCIQQGQCLSAGYKAWEKIEEYGYRHNLIHNSTRRFGTTLDPREITDDENHRYVAMISVGPEVESDGEFFVQTIGDGLYAGILHDGSYERLYCTCISIYLNWLPQSGHKLRSSSVLDEYIVVRDLTRPPDELRTRIMIPIQQ
jgi:AraC family transcriptional regulator